MGLDVADAELLEQAAEVGGVLGAVQLFLERPVAVVADQDIEAVAVDREGQAVLPEDLGEDDGVAMETLGRPEMRRQELRGGVIDGAPKGSWRARAPRATHTGCHQPAPGRRRRLPAGAGCGEAGADGAAGWAAPPRAHRGPADGQVVLLLQLLGEVDIVEAG